MISVKEQNFRMGRVLIATGTANDMRLWFSTIMHLPGAFGKINKKTKTAIVEIPVRRS